MKYLDFDKTAAYKKLSDLSAKGRTFDFGTQLKAERVRQCTAPMASGLTYSWAAKSVDESVTAALQALGEEQELIEKYKAIL
ncbi:MAG: glucose-6-phosphate isomerase, partial [Treponema sp.]|nr:glucose-6-phosphate isomerase [Treponema sp.]